MSTPRLVEAHPVPASSIGDAVRDDELAVYIRGEYAGRLCRSRAGWICDSELDERIPWPRRSRGKFVSLPAALRTIRRRLRDAEREARIRERMEAAGADLRHALSRRRAGQAT